MPGHFHGMSEQAVTGHVGASVDRELLEKPRGGAIETAHAGDSLFKMFGLDAVALVGCGYHAGADWLGQDQPVARLRAGFGKDSVGVHLARHRQAVLRFLVGHGVPTGDHRSGFQYLVRAAQEDAAQDVQVEVVRKACEVQGKERLASHGVDVAQSVGSRNLAERVGIVYDRREEVRRADDGLLVVHAIDGSIIGCGQTYQEIAIGLGGKGAQNLRELGGAEFARSPRASGQAGQLYRC